MDMTLQILRQQVAGSLYLPVMVTSAPVKLSDWALSVMELRGPGLCADDYQAQAVEGTPLPRLEGFVAGGVAVADGNDFARSLQLELHEILRPRNQNARPCRQPVTVMNERSLPSRADFRAVGLEQQLGRLAAGLHHVLRPGLTVRVRDNLEFARLIDRVVPTQAILETALLLLSQRFAVEEQLRLVAGGIDVYRVIFPMRSGQFQCGRMCAIGRSGRQAPGRGRSGPS